MPNFLPNVFFCEKKNAWRRSGKGGLVLLFFRFSFFLSLKRQEKENEKRIFSIFSFFSFLEEKKKGMMQRKRRSLKKEKWAGRTAKKQISMSPGVIRLLLFLFLWKKNAHPLSAYQKGRRPSRVVIFLFLCLFLFEKKTSAFPALCGPKASWTPKRGEAPEKKREGKAAKRQMSVSRTPFVFWFHFPLKKEYVYFSRKQEGSKTPKTPGTRKEKEKRRGKRGELLTCSLFFFLFF